MRSQCNTELKIRELNHPITQILTSLLEDSIQAGVLYVETSHNSSEWLGVAHTGEVYFILLKKIAQTQALTWQTREIKWRDECAVIMWWKNTVHSGFWIGIETKQVRKLMVAMRLQVLQISITSNSYGGGNAEDTWRFPPLLFDDQKYSIRNALANFSKAAVWINLKNPPNFIALHFVLSVCVCVCLCVSPPWWCNPSRFIYLLLNLSNKVKRPGDILSRLL